MSDDDTLDIEQELEQLLTKIQPNLQDVIKRSFTNVAVQQSKNGEQYKPDVLEDTSYFAKNTQVNLTRLELVKNPSFHIQNLSLDLSSMALTFRCSLGDVNVKGLYSAYNENMYNLIPVMAEGHVLITLSNLIADVSMGLVLEDDALSYINPAVEFLHDEVVLKLSWPSPQRNGGYDFITTEQLAKHIDDLPLTAAMSSSLFCLLQKKLVWHAASALRRAASVSDMMRCDHLLVEAYSAKVRELALCGNRVVDLVLMTVRRTLLQGRRERLPLPPLHAVFLHKVGSVSLVGKFETGAGWLKNLETVNRISDVSVSRPDPMKTSFRVTLSIKDLQLGYDEYRLRAAGASCAGRLAATLGRCRLALGLSVGLARWEPYAQLDALSISALDGMELHSPGLGGLPGLAPRAAGWTRGALSAHAAPALLAALHAELHSALAELTLWDLVHGKVDK